MGEKTKKRLGEILVEDGILSKEDLQSALEHQKTEGGMIGQVLVRLGLISEEMLIAALGKQLGIPYLPLMNYSINMDTVHLMDEKFVRTHMVIPFDQDDKRIYLALSDPLDGAAVTEIEEKLHLKPQVFLATPTEIMNMLDVAFSQSSKKELKKAG